MAEQQSSSAMVPVGQVLDGEYMLEVKEFNQAGTVSKFNVPVPSTLSSLDASVMVRAAVLKRTTWKDKDFPTVLLAVMYSDRMGLDIMAGDVYMAEEGRLSTTADAKIRHAMASGKIEGYDVKIEKGDPLKIPYTLRNEKQTYEGVELTATVTVWVKGFKNPVVYETTLSEWFTGRNPNWRTRPAYMLRKNALSKALAEVAPMGVDADEAPPIDNGPAAVSVSNQAKAAVEAAKAANTKTEKE